MLADPLIAGQALQEAAVEAPGSLPVQIFQCGGLFQPGRAQTRLQAFLIAQAPFRVEEDPETFQEGHGGDFRMLFLVFQGMEHAAQVECTEPIIGGVGIHGKVPFQWKYSGPRMFPW